MSDTTLTLSPLLHAYLVQHAVRDNETLAELRTVTHQLSDSVMQISPEQGQFMALLVELINARKTLDIGTFTGYSSLVVALALPANGKVITFDINDEWTRVARHFWQKANVDQKIELRLGNAADSLQELINAGESNTFDFAFIDADKANYDAYYELSLELVRPGGLVAIDNVLWFGKVADPDIHDLSTQCIRALNTKVIQDERVTVSMLPIGDGLTLARKR